MTLLHVRTRLFAHCNLISDPVLGTHIDATCMIPIDKLLGVRHDLSLVQYSARCYALILLDEARDAQVIVQCLANINKYSPQRVHLKHQLHTLAYSTILAVEMHYCSNIQQTYFTYLVWTWSQRVSAWMHVWDTIEHDALRRDFAVPQYMDCELAANRMFIRNGQAFLVTVGYLQENPHGELVGEIDMETAAQALKAGHVQQAPATSAAMRELFCTADADAHFLSHVLDVQGVHLPKRYAHFLAQHPYLLAWPRDPPAVAGVDLSAIAADLDPASQCAYTVAMPNTPPGLSTPPADLLLSEYASLCIKANLVAHSGAAVKQGPPAGEVFLSEYLMQRLRAHGCSQSLQTARKVGAARLDCLQDGNLHVSTTSRTETTTSPAEAPPEAQAAAEEANEKSAAAIESVLQEVKQELHAEMTAADGLCAGGVDDDVDVDDFMEFYAKNYLHMNDQELALHRTLPEDPDWSAYNDDSDYLSDQ